MKRLEGRVAILMHGRGDTGAGIAERLRQEGCVVMAESALPESKAAAEAIVATAVAQHGRVDILLNAAEAPLAFEPLESKALAVGQGPQAVLWMMQAVFPVMQRQQGGRIVNLVAACGDSLNRQVADVVAASEAVKSLTRSAAEEWGRHNILVNALAIAADTESFRQWREAQAEAVDALVAASPMGRMGDPVADIGGAVLLLVGEAGRFLTGHVLYADGGQHLTPTPYEAVVPLV